MYHLHNSCCIAKSKVMNVRFRQIPSQTAAINGKNNSCSLCYGFIFNLLVALCTIGFLCYFLYRFDARLVSLERKLWNKEHGDGSLSKKEKIGSYGQARHHKQAILMRKARTAARYVFRKQNSWKSWLLKNNQGRDLTSLNLGKYQVKFVSLTPRSSWILTGLIQYNSRPPGDAFAGESTNARNARVTRVVTQRTGGKNATKPSNS